MNQAQCRTAQILGFGARISGISGQQKRCNMQVFIMRHGDAALNAASDAVRPLTECGRDESRQMAVWLTDQGERIDRVLVSPYLRAEQTLAVVAKELTLSGQTTVLPELTPGGDAQQVADYLHMLAVEGVSSVLVVSHLPLVGYLVSALCPQASPPMFTPSAIAYVTFDAQTGKGLLNWQMSPCDVNAEKMR